jgi:hypothetical protein
MMVYRAVGMPGHAATLVHLANRESLNVILTVDQADFATYRLEGKRRFRVVPVERP